MKTRHSFITLLLSVLFLTGFSFKSYSEVTADNFFAKGGDISWLPQMEASGYTFYDDNGDKQDCFQILKDHGFNTIRLRTWVKSFGKQGQWSLQQGGRLPWQCALKNGA